MEQMAVDHLVNQINLNLGRKIVDCDPIIPFLHEVPGKPE